MRVVVTGAGLVGTHAAAELSRRGHGVALLDLHPDPGYVAALLGSTEVALFAGDVADPDVVLRVLHAHAADAVVHTAGLLGSKAERHAYLAFRVNGGGGAAVAEAARTAGVRRLVHVSSLAVYDWEAATTGTTVDEDFPTSPHTVYGASKLAGELAVRCYAASGWLDATVLRLAGVYGPGRFAGGARAGSLLQETLARALSGEPVTVPARLGGHEYLHAGDAATVIRSAVEGTGSGVYNVGTGHAFAVSEVAEAVRRAVPGAVVAAGPRPQPGPGDDGPGRPVLCSRRARLAFPDWACRSLETGVAQLAATLHRHPWLARPTSIEHTKEPL